MDFFISGQINKKIFWLNVNYTFFKTFHKSVNLKYIMVGRLGDDMIVSLSDGAMFILIDWE